jgi:glycosyltransferase involved in cell wall biosynthesis
MSSKRRVSAILLSYNSADFVVEAVRSALLQDCEPMELLVSDDASTDGTFALIQSELGTYRGPHRVDLFRRSTNSGSKSAHLNDAFGRTSGEIVVSFDDDDVSHPHRVRRILSAFDANPKVSAVFSDFDLIDESGQALRTRRVLHPSSSKNTNRWFARVDAYAAGGTLAVRRSVVDSFPPLDPLIHEDIVLPFRASLLGEVEYIGEPLVRARRRAGSLTANTDRFRSVDDYRSRMHRGIERARRQQELRIQDLERAHALMPERAQEFDGLVAIVEESMADAEMTAGLVDPSPVKRIRALAQVLRSGAYREEAVQNVCLAVFPSLYLWYKRRSLGLSSEEQA